MQHIAGVTAAPLLPSAAAIDVTALFATVALITPAAVDARAAVIVQLLAGRTRAHVTSGRVVTAVSAAAIPHRALVDICDKTTN